MGYTAHIYRLVALAVITRHVTLAAPTDTHDDGVDKRKILLGRRSEVSDQSDNDKWADKREAEAYGYGDQDDQPEGVGYDMDADEKRAYGSLLNVDNDDIDSTGGKRVFKLGKRPSFKFGKRPSFKFGKRKLFKFGKRPSFKFGKRPTFKFGKRPSFKLGKRRLFKFGKRDPLEEEEGLGEEEKRLVDELSDNEKLQLYTEILNMMDNNVEDEESVEKQEEKRRQILLGKKPFGTGNFHWDDK